MLVTSRFALVVAAAVGIFFAFRPSSTSATSFTVDSTVDAVDSNPGDGLCADVNGACTLRAAVMETNALPGPDEISLPAGTYVLTIPRPQVPDYLDPDAAGDLDMGDVTISGAGAGTTIIDANDIDRVLHAYGDVSLSDITIQNGNTSSFGGGLEVNREVAAVLNNTVVRDNTAGDGGGISSAYASLTIDDSVVAGNRSSNDGGGIESSYGPLTLKNTTVTGNTAKVGGGGIEHNFGPVTINSSTVSGNTANFGGGIYKNFGSLTVHNSTVSSNVATGSEALVGSGLGGGILTFSVTLNVGFSTLNANAARNGGGGIFVDPSSSFKNTIIANSTGGNCFGSINSLYLLDSDGSCGPIGPGDISNVDAKLGPLADYGGPTQTHAVLDGSPAIDAGDSSDCPATDQRGVTRPLDGNGDGVAVCDIGAFEAEIGRPALAPDSTRTPTPAPAAPVVLPSTGSDDGSPKILSLVPAVMATMAIISSTVLLCRHALRRR